MLSAIFLQKKGRIQDRTVGPCIAKPLTIGKRKQKKCGHIYRLIAIFGHVKL